MAVNLLNQQRDILKLNYYDENNNITFQDITFNNTLNVTDISIFYSSLNVLNNITTNSIHLHNISLNNLTVYNTVSNDSNI